MDFAKALRILVGADEDPAEMLEVRLRDGAPMWVRPIRPDDRQRLVDGLNNLSQRSRYMRFHSNVNRLSDAQLTYLTEVDHHDHEALVGLDAKTGEGLGVARYIRLADEPDVAEAALTVVDAHQGRGVGTALLALLEHAARHRGVKTFRNYVLAENRAMLDIFADLDGVVTPDGPGVYRVDVPIADPSADDATPSARIMAAFASAGAPDLPPWVFPLLWARRLVLGGPQPNLADVLQTESAQAPESEETPTR